MSRKSNNDIIGPIAAFIAVLLFFYWMTDRSKFWLLFSASVILLIAIRIIVVKIRNNKFDKFNNGNDLLTKLRQMTPVEFEVYTADLYYKLGYETERVGGAYDGGIDVIATKNGIKHYIQCKKFITSKVGVGDLRNFYGAMAANLTNAKGIFITTNIFTTEAERFAEDKPIELIDGNKLLKLINTTKSNSDKDSIHQSENISCPLCGSKLVNRKSKFGEFIGCSAYPKCRYKK